MSDKLTKLEPCPFCGSLVSERLACESGETAVGCHDATCAGFVNATPEQWNRRHPLAEREIIERLLARTVGWIEDVRCTNQEAEREKRNFIEEIKCALSPGQAAGAPSSSREADRGDMVPAHWRERAENVIALSSNKNTEYEAGRQAVMLLAMLIRIPAETTEYVRVPREPTAAMLRPFMCCPTEELPLAWEAMLQIVKAQSAAPSTK